MSTKATTTTTTTVTIITKNMTTKIISTDRHGQSHRQTETYRHGQKTDRQTDRHGQT